MAVSARFGSLLDMRILLALGGKALLRHGEAAEADAQQRNLTAAAQALAAVASEHEVVITHGNGPPVGSLPYMLELALRNALPDRDVLTVLSEVVVSAEDPAFESASRLGGAPAAEPQAIVELRSIRTLIDAAVLVVCAGGGGIPVTVNSDGTMRSVEAVVDKDLTAALLARRLDADLLVMLTDVDAVHLGWGRDFESALGSATPAELREHGFAPGSMGPKVEAACRFVEATGHRAAIGELKKAVEIVRGASGTQISPPRA
jgi:carbamate kinase